MASSRRQEEATLPCPAWIWSSGSNVHIAKDRFKFGDDYTPVDSFVETAGGHETKVVGIKELPTKILPKRTGPRSHEYCIDTSGSDGITGTIANLSGGCPVAYFKPENEARLFEVRLSGPPVGPRVGPSPFNPSMKYVLFVICLDNELERCAAALQNSRQYKVDTQPLMPPEKAWLKKHFGSEFKFLQRYGLSIYKDEDHEDKSDDQVHDESDDESDEFNPEDHFADHHFSNKELEWIDSNYDNSAHFMLCFGLKFYKDEDCEEAKMIVRAMMEADEDDYDDSSGVGKTT